MLNHGTVQSSTLQRDLLCPPPELIRVHVKETGYLTQLHSPHPHQLPPSPLRHEDTRRPRPPRRLRRRGPLPMPPRPNLLPRLRRSQHLLSLRQRRLLHQRTPLLPQRIRLATEQFCIRRNLPGKEIRLPVASSSAAFDAVVMENQNEAPAN
ncbi:hypothetical protein L596_010589 [Steinernema carpocapsae]|uniref:Uncharacterized protein n=1 Tax=Steinernema carpocapsae TaxID=34508 RepID=A0A4U5PIZ9_STECR|nr:hypothetical protein L596_010589 [Steinernema carpocapsae]